MKKYDYVLFDFDGTLVDTAYSLQDLCIETFSLAGIKITKEEALEFIHHSLEVSFTLKGVPKKFFPKMIKHFHDNVGNIENVKKTILYKDTFAVCDRLDELNIPYGIVTGNCEYNVRNVLRYHKIDENRFKDIIGNDSFNKSKPDPDCVLTYLKKNNIDKNKVNVLYVGDADQDILCCKAAKIDYVIVRRDNKPNKGEYSSLFDFLTDFNKAY